MGRSRGRLRRYAGAASFHRHRGSIPQKLIPKSFLHDCLQKKDVTSLAFCMNRQFWVQPGILRYLLTKVSWLNVLKYIPNI